MDSRRQEAGQRHPIHRAFRRPPATGYIAQAAVELAIDDPQKGVVFSAMKILELNHVAIHVADVERELRVSHRDVLRLEMLPHPAFDFPGAWFRLRARTRIVHLIGRSVAICARQWQQSLRAAGKLSIVAWEEHLQQTGAEFRPRKQRPDGAWQIFLRDPDGHYIELFTPEPI